MKKIFLTILFAFVFSGGITANNLSSLESGEKLEVIKIEPKECTVTIKGTFDGVEVDIEVTVETSWVECIALKAGVKSALKE